MEQNETITEQRESKHFIQFIREHTGSQLFKIAIILFIIGACLTVISQIALSFQIAIDTADLVLYLVIDLFIIVFLIFPIVCILLVYKDSNNDDLKGGMTLTVLKIAQVCLIIVTVLVGLGFLFGFLGSVILIATDDPSLMIDPFFDGMGFVVGIILLVVLLIVLPFAILSFISSFKVLGGLKRNIENNEFKPIPMGTFFVVYNFVLIGFSALFIGLYLLGLIVNIIIGIAVFSDILLFFALLLPVITNSLFLVILNNINKGIREYGKVYN